MVTNHVAGFHATYTRHTEVYVPMTESQGYLKTPPAHKPGPSQAQIEAAAWLVCPNETVRCTELCGRCRHKAHKILEAAVLPIGNTVCPLCGQVGSPPNCTGCDPEITRDDPAMRDFIKDTPLSEPNDGWAAEDQTYRSIAYQQGYANGEKAAAAELERWREIAGQGVQIEFQLRKEMLTLEATTIERCAQVADELRMKYKTGLGCDPAIDAVLEMLAAAIGALKDKP